LCRRFNFFPRVLMKASFGDPSRLSSSLHAQYLAPFPDPDSRKGTWVFPRAIIGESEWLGAIWARRAALAHIPALLIWGMKDAAFAPLLPRWREAFAHHRCVLLADVSHNVAEEAAERLFAPIESFLNEEPA
jgi:haloalkane dehalogenase